MPHFKKRKTFNKKIRVIALIFVFLVLTAAVYILSKQKMTPVNIAYRNTLDYKKIDSCRNSTNKSVCVNEVLYDALNRGGVELSLDALKYIYEHDKEVEQNCHYFTHYIGEQAYQKFKRNEKITLTPKTSYCGFGFYHGFTEALFKENGSIDEARKFCYFTDKSLSGSAIRPSTACFHGIGHGAVDGSEISAWGKAQALLKPALDICEKLPNEKEKYECASGAFNSLAIAYSTHKYGLIGDKNNPFADCTFRNETYYHHACYEEMNTYVLTVTKNELRPALRFAENVHSDVDASYAAQNVGGAFAQHMKTQIDFDKAADVCQKIQKRLTPYCITGIVGGLFEFGKPGLEHERPVTFCSSALFSEENKTLCFSKLTEFLNGLFPKEKTAQICQSFPNSYRYICQK